MLAAQIESVLEPPAEAKQRKRQATEAEIAGYMRDRAENAARMREYVEQHNLRNVDPLGARWVCACAPPARGIPFAGAVQKAWCCRAESRCFRVSHASKCAECDVH